MIAPMSSVQRSPGAASRSSPGLSIFLATAGTPWSAAGNVRLDLIPEARSRSPAVAMSSVATAGPGPPGVDVRG